LEKRIERILELDLPKGQSCFLWGARKTGKSTFLKERYPEALWIDLLEAETFQRYLREPQQLRHGLQKAAVIPLVIIDEIQRVPELLNEVHWMIENMRVQFILCGSSSRRLRTSRSNLLGGRAWRFMFAPLCYPELKELDWSRIFNNGLIPSHYLSSNPQRSLASYLFDYTLTEVQVEASLRNREPFARFLEILGFCNGEMINFSNIGRDCGVDRKTIQTYFEILEDMYLGYFVRPYKTRQNRQIVQQIPKFYLFDTGIASYLKRFHYAEMRGADAGHAFEHYVFLELTAYRLLKEKRDSICYWRTKDGYEVDFVFQDKAIEVKMSSSISKQDFKNLLVFSENEKKSLHIVCLESHKRFVKESGKEINIWPVEEFLKALWQGEVWT
jgi:predicted AAA+ superfamily ATPase